MNSIKNLAELTTYVNSGESVEYLFFWGHRPRKDGAISETCLSQWYDAPFKEQGISYKSAEHYMMAAKAKLFADTAALREILDSPNPGDVKAIGRRIKGYDDDQWNQYRYSIVVAGNYAKFEQHAALKEYLLLTGDRILVEASPTDKIWGIGLSKNDPEAANPNMWKGANLLGFALMEARELIRFSPRQI
jgi:ribA/ribD-fused uncharacterized protein